MVGVSKKAGGCVTCRNRKVKCDRRTPVCGPCSVKNRDCIPYCRDFTFVYRQGNEKDSAGGSENSVLSSLQQHIKHTRGQSKTRIERFNTKPHYEDQLLGHFLNFILPSNYSTSDVFQLSSFAWVEILPSIKNNSPTLSTATLALATSLLGRQKADAALLHESLDCYGKTMRKFQQDLYSPKSMSKNETLAICLILVLYQIVCEKPGDHDWISHVQGIASIVLANGPEHYREGLGQRLFFACRNSLVVASICTGKPTFLSQQGWLQIPWESSEKSLYHSLVDLMTFLPGATYPADLVKTPRGVYFSVESRVRLVQRCWNLERCFREWYKGLQQERPTIWLTDAKFTTQADKLAGYQLFPQCYNFPSLTFAHLHSMYWAALLMIYAILKLNYDALAQVESSYYAPEHPSALRCRTCYSPAWAVSQTGPSKCECGFIESLPQFDVTNLPPLTEEHDAQSLACKICMTVEYCTAATTGLIGPQATLFPFKVAMRSLMGLFPKSSACLGWCLAMVDLLEERGLSFNLAGFGVHNDLVPERFFGAQGSNTSLEIIV